MSEPIRAAEAGDSRVASRGVRDEGTGAPRRTSLWHYVSVNEIPESAPPKSPRATADNFGELIRGLGLLDLVREGRLNPLDIGRATAVDTFGKLFTGGGPTESLSLTLPVDVNRGMSAPTLQGRYGDGGTYRATSLAAARSDALNPDELRFTWDQVDPKVLDEALDRVWQKARRWAAGEWKDPRKV